MKDGLGSGNNLEYTHTYYLEFNFTNWAGLAGAEYLNGTVNNNGTVYDGEISMLARSLQHKFQDVYAPKEKIIKGT